MKLNVLSLFSTLHFKAMFGLRIWWRKKKSKGEVNEFLTPIQAKLNEEETTFFSEIKQTTSTYRKKTPHLKEDIYRVHSKRERERETWVCDADVREETKIR